MASARVAIQAPLSIWAEEDVVAVENVGPGIFIPGVPIVCAVLSTFTHR